MGADYLSATLVAEVNDDGTPKLDWAAGHAVIDALPVDQETLDSMEYGETWSEVVAALHAVLKEVEDSLHGRDVGSWRLGPLIIFESGGMSWGDAPTDACDVWWKWDDEYMPEGIENVMKAVGFMPFPGGEDSPYVIVKRTDLQGAGA